MLTIDDKIAILIDEGCACDICKYVKDCRGISAGPNGPIYAPCEYGMKRCVDESIVEVIWAEREDDGEQ